MEPSLPFAMTPLLWWLTHTGNRDWAQRLNQSWGYLPIKTPSHMIQRSFSSMLKITPKILCKSARPLSTMGIGMATLSTSQLQSMSVLICFAILTVCVKIFLHAIPLSAAYDGSHVVLYRRLNLCQVLLHHCLQHAPLFSKDNSACSDVWQIGSDELVVLLTDTNWGTSTGSYVLQIGSDEMAPACSQIPIEGTLCLSCHFQSKILLWVSNSWRSILTPIRWL